MSAQQASDYSDLVRSYVAALRAGGLDVVDTEPLSVEVDGRSVPYLIQPMLPADTLGEQVLQSVEPDPDHPFLSAVADTIGVVTDQLSVDAQITNFSWRDGTATLLDVGTPFLWDDDGQLLFDMDPLTPMIPAPLRSTVKRDLTSVVDRWREPRAVAVDVVANLYRQGLTDWVDATLVALNRVAPGEPIQAAEAEAHFRDDAKTFPRLVRLQRIERFWRTRVQRKPYDYFICSTYDGGQLG